LGTLIFFKFFNQVLPFTFSQFLCDMSVVLQSSNLVKKKILFSPLSGCTITRNPTVQFHFPPNIAITEISRTTNNRTRQTLLLANNRS